MRAIAKRRHLKVHMDGARFANAVATLNVHPSEITWCAGVDVLCFGGTKNSLPVGEAVMFFDQSLATDFVYRLKQAGQLASKMRFISAPWLGLLDDDVWLRNARHANAMAQLMAARLADIPGVAMMFKPESNAVFAELPAQVVAALRAKGWRFFHRLGRMPPHVETCCSFFAPIVFPDRIDAGLRVEKLGNTSVRYEVAIFAEGSDTAAAQGHFVHVYVDRVTRRPAPLVNALKPLLAG